MKDVSRNRGWRWAYSKTRRCHVNKLQALYRATRYWLTGDTGNFSSHGGFRKTRIRRPVKGEG